MAGKYLCDFLWNTGICYFCSWVNTEYSKKILQLWFAEDWGRKSLALTSIAKEFWLLTSATVSVLPTDVFCILQSGYCKLFWLFNLLLSSASPSLWPAYCPEKTVTSVGIPFTFYPSVHKVHSDYTPSPIFLTSEWDKVLFSKAKVNDVPSLSLCPWLLIHPSFCVSCRASISPSLSPCLQFTMFESSGPKTEKSHQTSQRYR